MKDESSPMHPGQYVREKILKPRNITVTEAAKLIGISRPGVSNFLNGKVAASPDMAARLARAFDVPAKTILALQSEFDAHVAVASGSPQNARPYVAPFLEVRANDITDWFTTTIAARTKLSVLLRILVHSTGCELQSVDFPGNDDAERPGWDGHVSASSGTPWIPSGISGWEFGVNSDIRGKADGDFSKSVKAIQDKKERLNTTFVFVTPRRWPGKSAWVTEMKSKGLWKDVRAYDASDLEQWIENSLAAQTWFANQTSRPSSGVRTMDKCWTDWSSVAEPPLHPAFFETAIDIWRDTINSFFSKDGRDPLMIAADSVEEALGFLAQILTDPELAQYKDQVLVFDDPGVLPRLALGAANFVAVAHTREVEREFGPHSGSLKTIVIYPRNATNEEPDILLEPLGYEPFNKGLESMGKGRDDANRLANESGRSLTVLRRRLSTFPAIQTPEWAADHNTSSGLIPMMLVGAWDAQNETDKAALSLIAGDSVTYASLDSKVQQLLRLNDSPIWSIGNYRGVISKIDSLFAISGAVTKADIDRFYDVARMVLGEDDPTLDLPDEDRWAAALHGKKREFSSALREGISETLVLLAVHGKNLFGTRFGFDGEAAAANLVRQLLEPIETRKLEANDRDLPLYAEAAPEEFLSIIERDLRSAQPQTVGLLRPADTGFFGSPARTGLLWALEGLAWNPATFPRVVRILGQLSETEINDNWVNKPIESLGSIFRAWMPQTSADHEARLKALEMLLDRHPSVGWKICLQQFGDYGNRVGGYSHKPKWRSDGYGFGEPFKTWEPVNRFVWAMVEIALTRESYSVEMLCDLIARLHALSPRDQDKVWQIIDDWRENADDDGIAKVRDKIRTTVLSRRRRKKTDDQAHARLSKKARAIFDSLQPTDIVSKHEWLFRQGWVEESADELTEDELDFQARERRVEKLRIEALSSIFQERGLDGVFALAEKGSSQGQIGAYLARDILNLAQVQDMILRCLRPSPTNAGRDNIATGALLALDREARAKLHSNLRDELSEQEALRYLLLSPYRSETWVEVDKLGAAARSSYWLDVIPGYIFDAPDENNESVRRLLDAKRPRAAFSSMHFKLEEIRPPLLVQALSAMLKDGNDKPGEYQFHDYDLQRAFQLLSDNPDVSFEEKAGLEFAYLDVLARSFRGGDGHHIPNLERYIEDHPEMFVQAVVWTYRRKSRGEDPPEFRIEGDPEKLASRGYRLLEAIERIPGQDESSDEKKRDKLKNWIGSVRTSCSELDRADIGDVCLGKLLSCSAEGSDGVWPNEIVRDLMEELQSEEISNGARTGLYNSRGVHWRGEGGTQERELADKYRRWAEALQFTHPFVASSLLMSMVRTYEDEADRQDTEAGIRRRLRH